MTTILGSVGISQLSDPTDTTKVLAINYASAATGTTSTLTLPAAGQSFTLPNASTTLVGENTAQTLTNKTINASVNTITNISNSSIDPSAAIDGSKISGNISGNAANITGIVAIANGGTNAANIADARTNLSAAQSGANADITSLSETTTVALKGTTNSVNLQAQAATTAWTLQFPLDAGTNGQFLRTNGSGVASWAAASGGGGSFPAMGDVAIVDQVNGNDGTASVGGLPFLTITAALAAVTANQQVYILPGTYSESITIPADVYIRGISTNAVVIQQLAVTTDTTLVTMGVASRLEDVTLVLTSATAGLTLKGIVFPSTSTVAAKCRNTSISITNTSTGTGTIYGVHSNGTGTATVGQDNIRACTINISAAVTTKVVGIYSDTANTIRFRDLNINVQRTAGAGLYYGLETNNASSVIVCRHSTLTATTADISQTLGTIQLSYTTLQTNSANSLPFTSLDSCKVMTFSVIGASGNAVTRYMRICGAPATVEILHFIPTSCIVKRLSCWSRVAVAAATSVTFTVRRNGINTSISTTMSPGQTTAEITTISQSYTAGDYISIQYTAAGNTATQDIMATLELY